MQDHANGSDSTVRAVLLALLAVVVVFATVWAVLVLTMGSMGHGMMGGWGSGWMGFGWMVLLWLFLPALLLVVLLLLLERPARA